MGLKRNGAKQSLLFCNEITGKSLDSRWMLLDNAPPYAPVAQLDRVPGYEPGGRRFESFRARHLHKKASAKAGAFFISASVKVRTSSGKQCSKAPGGAHNIHSAVILYGVSIKADAMHRLFCLPVELRPSHRPTGITFSELIESHPMNFEPTASAEHGFGIDNARQSP